MHQAPGEQCWHTRAHMEAGPMAPCCMAWDLVAQLGISLHGSGPCCMAWDPATWLGTLLHGSGPRHSA